MVFNVLSKLTRAMVMAMPCLECLSCSHAHSHNAFSQWLRTPPPEARGSSSSQTVGSPLVGICFSYSSSKDTLIWTAQTYSVQAPQLSNLQGFVFCVINFVMDELPSCAQICSFSLCHRMRATPGTRSRTQKQRFDPTTV